MRGCDLKEGVFDSREVSEDELWSAVACIFSAKSKNNASYKFGFLKSILDNIDNADNDLILTFDQLFARFAELYWNLILEYNMKQSAETSDNKKSAIERVILEAKDKYMIDDIGSFDSLQQKARVQVVHQVKMQCKKYVVGALFEDTKRLFYSFSKKGEWIKINPQMYKFICERKSEIEKLNNYEWTHFLEKINAGYSTNTILSNYILKSEKSQINTQELLFEAEITGENNSTTIKESVEIAKSPYGRCSKKYICKDTNNAYKEIIDEEAMKLLDDPVALIKLLKTRREIWQ